MKPTKEMIDAAKNVLECRAMVETLKPVINKIQSDLVAQIQPKDENGNLLSPGRQWMMTDEYAAVYYPALDEAYKAAGFNVQPGYCPLLMAETNEREAVRLMNKLATSLVPGGMKVDTDKIYNLDTLKKLTDLNLQYISQFFKR